MKSLISVVFVIAIIAFNSFGQNQLPAGLIPTQKADPCENKTIIGVEVQVNGFSNNVEATKLAVAVMNEYIVNPQAPYCLAHTVGKSTRRLQVTVLPKGQGNEQGADGIDKQIARKVIKETVPGKYQDTVKGIVGIFSPGYVVAPNINLDSGQFEVITKMFQGDKLLWAGYGTREFTVKTTRYPGRPGSLIEIAKGGVVRELLPYMGSIIMPRNDSLGTVDRANQLMKFLVVMDSMKPENIVPSEEELLRQRQLRNGR